MKQAIQNMSRLLMGVFGLLLLLLLSSTAFASHFKSGHLTYNYLGDGRYEFLITGYWEKSEVGYVFPRYEGRPRIHGFPLTVSKTLMEDGETVEHIQRQEVSWSKAGVYEVYWKSCCRKTGANFNGNPMGLFAAVNYNPAAPGSSPKYVIERDFNFNSRQKINYTLHAEDADGHEQEYSLEIPFGMSADVYKDMLNSGFELSAEGKISWPNPIEGKWLISVRQNEQINGTPTGAYIDREFILEVVTPGDKADKKDKQGKNAMARKQTSAESLGLLAPKAVNGLQVYPNPITTNSQLKVVLEEADEIKVDIVDLSGKLVKTLYAGEILAGQELLLNINSSDLGGSPLMVARLTTSNGVQTVKLVVQ